MMVGWAGKWDGFRVSEGARKGGDEREGCCG